MDIEIKEELKKVTNGLSSLVTSLAKIEELLLEIQEPNMEVMEVMEDIDQFKEIGAIALRLAEQNKLEEAKQMLIVKHGLNTLAESEQNTYKTIRNDLLNLLNPTG